MNLNGSIIQAYIPEMTADGSFTFFSSEFDETFHSNQGAIAEALLKFVEPTQLRQKAQMDRVCLLDICYGLGYNTAVALEVIWQVNPDCLVEVIALESDLAVPQSAIAHLDCHPVSFWHNLEVKSVMTALAEVQEIATSKIHARLLVGDARNTLQEVKNSGFLADAIFLDPFSPPKCPQLWTVEFINLVSQCLKLEGRLATYSCAAAVRQALLLAKLYLGATNPVGRRSPGTVASFSHLDLPTLSPQEREHLLTRAAVPYRDPNLEDTNASILKRREAEQDSSALEPTSHWKKRWEIPKGVRRLKSQLHNQSPSSRTI
jgi:tRNA U34 5-methylaminomethyl-2-thiouridine-forming methyltransferase MnmC